MAVSRPPATTNDGGIEEWLGQGILKQSWAIRHINDFVTLRLSFTAMALHQPTVTYIWTTPRGLWRQQRCSQPATRFSISRSIQLIHVIQISKKRNGTQNDRNQAFLAVSSASAGNYISLQSLKVYLHKHLRLKRSAIPELETTRKADSRQSIDYEVAQDSVMSDSL
jgi:hypothetical protein